ncbi:MAG: hypothetical protein QS748_10070 [Candidatus Endonucleobacter bathymodioli]|uniref:Uncharacterized protein n=1 Tax=Candidatus Endonucleibacter bathymodioli TaxID=539814 RepID=A0AA90NMU1_9GAMM|nr:hypothetical protein [Candidatus Endonucleobacter bathymodioli]
MKFLLYFPIVMTISFAFSQEMYLSSKFFSRNTAVIVPYILGSTPETKNVPLACTPPYGCTDGDTAKEYSTFNFKTHHIPTYTDSIENLIPYSWTTAPTFTSTEFQLETIHNLLTPYNENILNTPINFMLNSQYRYYSIRSDLSHDNDLISYIKTQIPDLNRWMNFISKDRNLSSYTSCVQFSNTILSTILSTIKTRQTSSNEEAQFDISIHTSLHLSKPVAIALLEKHENTCRIQYICTNPYAQLDQLKHDYVHGADKALLHSIIRNLQKEGHIQHIIIINHLCEEKDLLKSCWVSHNTEQTENSPISKDITYNTEQPKDNRRDHGPNNKVMELKNTEQPRSSRRKKCPVFCCFRK